MNSKSPKVSFDGYIQYSECSECTCELYNLIFQGDTDMTTSGLVALAKPNFKSVIITEATSEEWSNYRIDQIAQRINQEKNTTGFLVIEHQHFYNESGKKEWLPNCPICKAKHIQGVKKSLAAFVDDGGEIRVVNKT